MRTLAVLPVKSLDAAKGRLAAQLEPSPRAELAQAMLADVLAALARSAELEGVAVVTAEARAASAAGAAGAEVVSDTAQAGQSPAALLGIEHAWRAGYERVLLVPGDTPLLVPGDVDGLLRRSAAAELGVVIVADRHGTGTNALLLSPPRAIAPSFGPGSLARHVAAARAARAAHALEQVENLEHDVDTPEDLAALVARLRERDTATAAHTRATAALEAAPTEA